VPDGKIIFGGNPMKFAKYLVIAGGVIGLLGMFMPTMSGSMTNDGVTASVSLGPIMGVSISYDGESGEALGKIADAMLKHVEKQVDKVKAVLLVFFAPVVFILLFGLLGLKRFGRGKAIGALIFSLIALGGYAMLGGAIDQAAGVKGDGGMGAGVGLIFLMLAGLLGTVGGLMGIIKPEPKAGAAAPAPAAEGDA
jgi:hypothetical protein